MGEHTRGRLRQGHSRADPIDCARIFAADQSFDPARPAGARCGSRASYRSKAMNRALSGPFAAVPLAAPPGAAERDYPPLPTPGTPKPYQVPASETYTLA